MQSRNDQEGNRKQRWNRTSQGIGEGPTSPLKEVDRPIKEEQGGQHAQQHDSLPPRQVQSWDKGY